MSYTIKAGDTFASIGQKIGASAEQIQAANPGVSPTKLQVGQVIHLPGGSGGTYKIASGDTFHSIAQRKGVSEAALIAANPGVDPSRLQIGQIIHLPGGQNGATPAPPPSNGTGYVQYGGPASAFPDPSHWASFDQLWTQNVRLMKYHDSDSEIAMIKSAIETVSRESKVDARVILCIIVQESGGNVRVQSVSSVKTRQVIPDTDSDRQTTAFTTLG